MKKNTSLFASLCLLAGSIFATSSCSKSESPSPDNNDGAKIEVQTVISMEATERVYFNLSTGEHVPEAAINATNWDISFYALDRTIIVAVNSGSEGTGNAGAQIVESGFDDLSTAPESGYLSGLDATGDYLNWSHYTGSTEPQHAILPKPGTTIVVKTADGKYAKIQMLSLYEGNPNAGSPEFANLSTRPAFGYFSFRYGTQKDGSRNLKN